MENRKKKFIIVNVDYFQDFQKFDQTFKEYLMIKGKVQYNYFILQKNGRQEMNSLNFDQFKNGINTELQGIFEINEKFYRIRKLKEIMKKKYEFNNNLIVVRFKFIKSNVKQYWNSFNELKQALIPPFKKWSSKNENKSLAEYMKNGQFSKLNLQFLFEMIEPISEPILSPKSKQDTFYEFDDTFSEEIIEAEENEEDNAQFNNFAENKNEEEEDKNNYNNYEREREINEYKRKIDNLERQRIEDQKNIQELQKKLRSINSDFQVQLNQAQEKQNQKEEENKQYRNVVQHFHHFLEQRETTLNEIINLSQKDKCSKMSKSGKVEEYDDEGLENESSIQSVISSLRKEKSKIASSINEKRKEIENILKELADEKRSMISELNEYSLRNSSNSKNLLENEAEKIIKEIALYRNGIREGIDSIKENQNRPKI